MKYLVEKILFFLTKKIIQKYQPDVVGITGSMGKTSAKEIAVHILQSKFKVRGCKNSYDTSIGLALTVIGKSTPNRSIIGWCGVLAKGLKLWLFRDNNYPEILILELGAGVPGNLKYLASLVPLNVGVVTAIAPTHLQFFKTIKKIVQEKRMLISNLSKTSVAILNRDDAEVFAMKAKTEADVLTFGFHEEADVRASDINIKIGQDGRPEGMIFKVIYKGSIVPVYLPGVIGDHIIYPALSAIAIAVSLGINMVEVSQQLQNIIMPAGRMRLLNGIKNTLLIDDSYNSSPYPLKAALEAIAQIKSFGGRKILVLGDMLELGNSTEEAHREIGFRIAELGFDYLITVGEAAKTFVKSAEEAGLPDDSSASFNTAEEAGKFLQEKLRKDDIVLIKGSRVIRMEKVVKEVMAEPERAGELLVK